MTTFPAFAGVIGWPAAHSLSPAMMSSWLSDCGLEGTYGVFEVPATRFEAVVHALRNIELAGLNVTVPHKQAALALADEVSEAADAIGAANLLVFREGRIYADNTDIVGIEAALSGEPGDGPAVLFGAGGAARAAAFYLSRQNRPVRLVNRTLEKAEALSDAFGLDATIYSEATEGLMDEASLIINASSLGMGDRTALHPDFKACADNAMAFDMVYTPLDTAFLKSARAEGLETRDGLLMLVGQAGPSFEAFFGAKPPETDHVRALLIEKLGLST